MSIDSQNYISGSSIRQLASGGIVTQVRTYLSSHYARVLFLFVFLLPTLVATVYFTLIASDRYVSETRFIVRSVSKSSAEGASAYLQDFGIVRANDDTFAIQDYIHSRDAMHAIMERIDLPRIWSLEEADFWSKYGGPFSSRNDESLFRYYQKRVKVEKDAETGITTVKVSAFRPQDAWAIAQLILELSEARINEMNVRARRDNLALAEQSRSDAARQLAGATVAVTRYRNATQLIDPSETAGAMVKQNSALSQELAELKVRLETMLNRAPGNPSIPALRQRIAALSGQIVTQQADLTGDQSALSGKVGTFERLEVERQLAEMAYEEARKQFDQAREESDRQQVFIETIARPNLADEPAEPRRFRYSFTVALLSFWAFLIFYLLVSGSREHLNLS